MTIPHPGKILIAIGIALAAVLCIVIFNYLFVRYNGKPVPAPDIPRGAERYGEGLKLTYAVLGDSTSISQGGEYDRGYARTTARHLASKGYEVSLHNFGISGARAADIDNEQVARAQNVKPDIVLIAVGANDVTHLTKPSTVSDHLKSAIQKLRTGNSKVQIILTGSPDMGTVPRFPWPSRYIAGVRSEGINDAIKPLINNENMWFAPIAENTGPIFADHPELYAQDKFHPTTAGYDTWSPVINSTLDKVTEKLPKL